MAFDSVAIIGVGLLGGSIGRGLLERRLARRVIGIGRRAERLHAALAQRAVTETSLSVDAVADAELVVVCTPVRQIVPLVQQAAAAATSRRPLITDVASTKAEIVHALTDTLPPGTRFVGSHPIAGGEQAGVEHANPQLFVSRTTVVTPTAATDPADVQRVRQFWESLGSTVVEMSPEDHDAALAATSHLPHLVAAGLAAVTPEKILHLTAGGWRDTTRVAAGDPQLWEAIITSNRANILSRLDGFATTMAAFREAIAQDDRGRLIELLVEAKRTRDALGD